ncbi:MAG: tRNA glutamyl-Q(34) synthetase GluQRS [Rhodospirillales bacterium 69-11]|mgnify:CR=1 FL=1|nr:tRNA glutamyl-Q(34) synthetase GluQRS [Rhodospirillales bacterium]OJW26000.1 MAG: tRNA glutamyl-Q(34) synthetase GluQRS [Rhodospirillales bacterium 69-11]
MSIVTRFAPSPTGFLHLGHVASALVGWRCARAAGGRFLLRIEDIDPTRCRPEFAAAIEEDLAWAGLSWDGPVRAQSAHLPAYRAVLTTLAERGLLYPCFCTRAEIQREVREAASAPHAPDGSLRYPGTCRALTPADRRHRLAAGAPHVLRLDMAAALRAAATPLWFDDLRHGRVLCAPERFGDVVLARRDAPASYHLCVTHDDAVQDVTLVTRGDDLLAATDVHRVLQAVMGWPAPRYLHHPLLTDAEGRRLAKRDQALSVRALRAMGVGAEEVRRRATLAIPCG